MRGFLLILCRHVVFSQYFAIIFIGAGSVNRPDNVFFGNFPLDRNLEKLRVNSLFICFKSHIFSLKIFRIATDKGHIWLQFGRDREKISFSPSLNFSRNRPIKLTTTLYMQ